MKLLGWMHRKFRQNSGEELGGAGGGACNCLSGRPSLDLDLNRRRLRRHDPLEVRSFRIRVEAVDDGGDEGADQTVEELWGGLLAIGTLGVETAPIEEKMEDLAASEEVEGKALEVEAIAKKEAEATTETDLIMVSAELEKVLAAEEEKGGGRMSSARSSHAGPAACPLQGFLFGLPVEATETALMAEEAAAAGGSRKEKRASLGELFMMSRITEEREGAKEGDSKIVEVDRQGNLTAKMCFSKKKHHGKKESDGAHSSNGSTVEKKLQKILQLFHKKVHPESSTFISKKFSKTSRAEKDYVPGRSDRKVATVLADSSGKSKREHWIKTDAEYLVLEL